MITLRTLVLFLFALSPCYASAAIEDHIKRLASRYDLVGLVTHTSMHRWNKNKERNMRMYPVDPSKVPGGALYVGLAEDHGSDTPYFGDIYIKGTLYGYNELFVRIHEVKGLQMRAMDDAGNEFLIQIVRRGSGYKRR